MLKNPKLIVILGRLVHLHTSHILECNNNYFKLNCHIAILTLTLITSILRMMLYTLVEMEVMSNTCEKNTLPKVDCWFFILKIRRNPSKTHSFPKEKWL